MILALYGAGAMGREFRQIAEESGQWSGVVYIDDHAKAEELGGCPVYRFQVFRRQFTPDEVRFVVSIGEPKFRLEAFENMTRAGYSAGVLIDKNARISPDAEIGEKHHFPAAALYLRRFSFLREPAERVRNDCDPEGHHGRGILGPVRK